MATPLLKLYYDRYGPVSVYFSSKGLRDLYEECPYFQIIERPLKNKPFETSRHPMKRLPNESDSEALCRIHFETQPGQVPHTFVPVPDGANLEKKSGVKYVAIFHGCLNDKNIPLKDLGKKVRKRMIDLVIAKNAVPVLLGTKGDYKRFWSSVKTVGAINYLGQLSLKDSVSILSQCDCFISNDTGMYHIAGALKMKGLVMWTRTNEIKNRSPAKEIVHYKNKSKKPNDFINAIDKFLSEAL